MFWFPGEGPGGKWSCWKFQGKHSEAVTGWKSQQPFWEHWNKWFKRKFQSKSKAGDFRRRWRTILVMLCQCSVWKTTPGTSVGEAWVWATPIHKAQLKCGHFSVNAGCVVTVAGRSARRISIMFPPEEYSPLHNVGAPSTGHTLVVKTPQNVHLVWNRGWFLCKYLGFSKR